MRSSWLRPTGDFLDDGLHTAFLNHNFLAFLVFRQHPGQIIQIQVMHLEFAVSILPEGYDSNPKSTT